jgi:hypothetical protein
VLEMSQEVKLRQQRVVGQYAASACRFLHHHRPSASLEPVHTDPCSCIGPASGARAFICRF